MLTSPLRAYRVSGSTLAFSLPEGERVGRQARSEAQLEQCVAWPLQRHERVQAIAGDRDAAEAVAVELHTERPAAAQYQVDVMRQEVDPQPRVAAREDPLALDAPRACVRERVPGQRRREGVARVAI